MQGDVVRRGRLTGERAGDMMHFLSSMKADRCIADADILVDIAHVMMLNKQKILGDEHARGLLSALLQIYDEGVPEAAFDDRYEDIHAGIESTLIAAVGEEVGGRLHIGRSRNDEVVTCMRLRLREDILKQLTALVRLREVLLTLAEEHHGTVMPGFTHFQHAQPTTLAHWMLAYEQAFARDFDRLWEAYDRVNRSPLGAAAFASTTYPINRELTAGMLGFSGLVENTMDAVASRDFALEVLADLTIMMATASRLCDDLILWSSGFIGFVTLDDAFCSTSSIMPQKKNPDTAEIMRAKAASLLGSFTAACATTKGLPMSYNRDLQELTPSLWRGVWDAKHSSRLLVDMLATARFHPDRMEAEAGKGNSTATDLADMLVRDYGLPFRTAHTIVGRAVQNGTLDLPTLDEAAKEVTGTDLSSRGLTAEKVRDALDVRQSVALRKARGGPAELSVKVACQERKEHLQKDQDSLDERMAAVSGALSRLIRDARGLVQ
ncbi:argininosuccinate lyase [Methanolinea mesophila]|uniref:argininosuccinate lyase n=1 Tax=Methanolinea mesophila TaxID=547055 RepID=UPI001AE2CC8A|nr:argininosuccinate lyase [Methanolinea mesophila]